MDEAVVEQLAPELLPMLVGLDPRQSFIPVRLLGDGCCYRALL